MSPWSEPRFDEPAVGSGNTALTKVHDVAVFKSWIVPRPEPTSRSDQSTTSELKYAGELRPLR